MERDAQKQRESQGGRGWGRDSQEKETQEDRVTEEKAPGQTGEGRENTKESYGDRK